MHEVTVVAVPAAGFVVLEVDELAVPLQPNAAMQAGLLLAKASIQTVAGRAENVEGFAIMLDYSLRVTTAS